MTAPMEHLSATELPASELPFSDQPHSGLPRVDHYLSEGYLTVPGMSSRFAAGICGHLMRRQSELGITGHAAEIGAFEGRFFIGLALGLQPAERAVGVDSFTWPDPGVEGRFAANCARMGLSRDRYTALKADAATLIPDDFRAALGQGDVRIFHIDGDHSHGPLLHDLSLATALMHPSGLIVLDDMLHPGYPFLVVTAHAYLTAHPDMRLMAIIDREDIVGAAKFVLCRQDAVALYEHDLIASFPQFHYVLGGDAMGHHCVVLTPQPRIAVV